MCYARVHVCVYVCALQYICVCMCCVRKTGRLNVGRAFIYAIALKMLTLQQR